MKKKIALDLDGVVFDSENLYRVYTEILNLSDVKIYNNEHKKIEKYLEEKVDYIIDDDDNICLNAAKNNINAIYFKNNASQKLAENEYIKNVNNWGEVYKYLMLKEFNEE